MKNSRNFVFSFSYPLFDTPSGYTANFYGKHIFSFFEQFLVKFGWQVGRLAVGSAGSNEAANRQLANC
ncbi:MAG: hypothetical protein RLZZ292_301 [Bacteroidota bacterium]|jgi:hypothetical protein